jgi:hypothetical protein
MQLIEKKELQISLKSAYKNSGLVVFTLIDIPHPLLATTPNQRALIRDMVAFMARHRLLDSG